MCESKFGIITVEKIREYRRNPSESARLEFVKELNEEQLYSSGFSRDESTLVRRAVAERISDIHKLVSAFDDEDNEDILAFIRDRIERATERIKQGRYLVK